MFQGYFDEIPRVLKRCWEMIKASSKVVSGKLQGCVKKVLQWNSIGDSMVPSNN